MITNVFAFSGIISLMFFWWGLEEFAPTIATADLNFEVLFYSLLAGIVPTLLWLWFWLKEDALNPEPRFMLILSFIAGMIAVPLVIPFQSLVYTISSSFSGDTSSFFTIIIGHENFLILTWAFIEEVFKFFVIYIIALRSKHYNEPVDALIYLITGALGFAALENVLYVITTLTTSGVMVSILNLHLRFLGATVLHVIASGSIGVCLAFAFYKKRYKKRLLIIGLSLATILHTLFNLFIINTETLLDTLIVFAYFWVIVIVLIYLFEKIKKINQSKVLQIPRPH